MDQPRSKSYRLASGLLSCHFFTVNRLQNGFYGTVLNCFHRWLAPMQVENSEQAVEIFQPMRLPIEQMHLEDAAEQRCLLEKFNPSEGVSQFCANAIISDRKTPVSWIRWQITHASISPESGAHVPARTWLASEILRQWMHFIPAKLAKYTFPIRETNIIHHVAMNRNLMPTKERFLGVNLNCAKIHHNWSNCRWSVVWFCSKLTGCFGR